MNVKATRQRIISEPAPPNQVLLLSAPFLLRALEVKADTLVYKILLFANPLFSPGWTVIKVFRGSFTHAVAKDGALTAQDVQRLPHTDCLPAGHFPALTLLGTVWVHLPGIILP